MVTTSTETSMSDQDSGRARVIAVIPARGGSKGIPRKNVRLLAGKPMIHYVIEAALAVEAIDAVIVSTDSDEIRYVAELAGRGDHASPRARGGPRHPRPGDPPRGGDG